MKAVAFFMGVFWAIGLGMVSLYGFLLLIDAIEPDEPTWLAYAMGGIAVLSFIHFIRVRRAINDGRHDELARSIHAMRERRGF
jgi:hypothetical protein